MDGAKSAVGSVAVWGGVVAVIAGAAQLIGYTISPNDQAALVNLIQSGVALVTTAATIIGGIMAIWGRVRATKEITGLTPASAEINAAVVRRTGLMLAGMVLASLSVSACQQAAPLPVTVPAAPVPPPSVGSQGGNTACAVLRWGVPLAISRLPTFGPEGQAVVIDAQKVIAAGCAEQDATWQQRAASAAGALVKVLWGLITG